MEKIAHYDFFKSSSEGVIKKLGKEGLVKALQQMLLIRNFETRAEAAYQHGKIGGFFHSYIGQEAIQTAAIQALGKKHWFITTYRCHALALLLDEPPNELMAELYGRATGNAKGRGGSMHLYSKNMLGGFGIVGGQIPIATGAAFRNWYLGIKDEIAVCFLGDGAMPQGAFHEALNMAALWKLPCMYIVENNQWSMGTHLTRGVANAHQYPLLAAQAYGMKGYQLNGMDFFNCYAGFLEAYEHVRLQGPVLIECITERFKGHSISDPGLYRSKEALKECMQHDPLLILKQKLLDLGMITEEAFKEYDKKMREQMIAAMQFADDSPWPDPATLEQDVFAP